MKTRQHVNMSDVIVKSRNSELQELQSDIIDCIAFCCHIHDDNLQAWQKQLLGPGHWMLWTPATSSALLGRIVTREREGKVIFQFNTTQAGG